jgi:hypothetical protein
VDIEPAAPGMLFWGVLRGPARRPGNDGALSPFLAAIAVRVFRSRSSVGSEADIRPSEIPVIVNQLSLNFVNLLHLIYDSGGRRHAGGDMASIEQRRERGAAHA